MSALAHPRIDPLDLFYERCCDHVENVRDGRTAFLDAVDLLWDAAVASGLVHRVGDDMVQHVMSVAFINAREGAEHSAPEREGRGGQ
jgi:hypothetical protein